MEGIVNVAENRPVKETSVHVASKTDYDEISLP